MMFIELSDKHSQPLGLTHSPYTTEIARIRCYTTLRTVVKCQDVQQHTISVYIKCQDVQQVHKRGVVGGYAGDSSCPQCTCVSLSEMSHP